MPSRFLLYLIAFYSLLRFLLPGDIPFINDEALLLKRAAEDAARHTWSVAGLMGSRGLEYGPFAIWFYRFLLFFTKNVQWIALFKMAFFYLGTLGGIVWISYRGGLSSARLVLLALLSPYLWFYSRDLWDNSFVIPLSSLFFASYYDFSCTRRFASLIGSVLFLSLGFLTHLVFVPIVCAFLVHFLFFDYSYYKRNIGKTAVAGVLCLSVVFPYLFHALRQRPAQHFETGDLGHLLMPFTGARFFTSLGLEYFIGETWLKPFELPVLNFVWVALLTVSALAYPLFVFGLVKMLREFFKNSLFRIVLISFAFQVALSFTYRLIPIPNFHSAQWLVYLLALGVALESLGSFKGWVPAYLTSLALAIPAFMLLVHVNGGSRAIHYGATLKNQMQLARHINEVNPQELAREAFHAAQFPFAIDLLREFDHEKNKSQVKTAAIRYENPQDPKSARLRLEVVE